MKLHRFYIGDVDFVKGQQLALQEERILHQWKRVLRLVRGDRVILFNAHGYESRVTIVALEHEAVVRIEDVRAPSVLPGREVDLYCALLKRSNFELILQKATEVGVRSIVPLVTERTEKQGFKRDRYEKIVVEAAEQCGRVSVPMLYNLVSYDEALNSAQTRDTLRVLCDERGRAVCDDVFSAGAISLFIGPEGGFLESEVQRAVEQNARIVSLSSLTLRAETAAIVAAYGFVQVW